MSDYFYFGFYKYLFSDLGWCDNIFHKMKVVYCRARKHPSGPIWYSSGLEPDMSCKNCGDEL